MREGKRVRKSARVRVRERERNNEREGDREKIINETRIHKIESYREKTEERRYFFIFLTRSLGDER